MKRILITITVLTFSFAVSAQSKKPVQKPTTQKATTTATPKKEIKSATPSISWGFLKNLGMAMMDGSSAELNKDDLKGFLYNEEFVESQQTLNDRTLKFISIIPKDIVNPEKSDLLQSINEKLSNIGQTGDYNKILIQLESCLFQKFLSENWAKKERAIWLSELANYK